jgi:hypothetical protein
MHAEEEEEALFGSRRRSSSTRLSNRTRAISFPGAATIAGGVDTRVVTSVHVITMLPLKRPMKSVIADIRRETEDRHTVDKTPIQAATSQAAEKTAAAGTRSRTATAGGATLHKNATGTRTSR